MALVMEHCAYEFFHSFTFGQGQIWLKDPNDKYDKYD